MENPVNSHEITHDKKRNRPGFFQRIQPQLIFVILIIIALALSQTPYVVNFLSWQTTFFHEISHGLAALVTGGGITKIELHFAGSGLCYTSGGSLVLISLAGYAGAALWGLLIYLAAGTLPKNYSHVAAVFLAAVPLLSGLLYVRDHESWAIVLAITVFYAAAVKLRNILPVKLILKIAGIYIIIDAFRAPFVLLRHKDVSDAANLAALTGIPEFFWILAWIAISLGCLAFIWKTGSRRAVRAKQL